MRYGALVLLLSLAVISGCGDSRTEEANKITVMSQVWPAEATQLSWLAENSKSVIEGVVTDSPQAIWTSDLEHKPTISTQVNVRVTKVLKGAHQVGSVTKIVVPGGTLDGTTVVSEGMPRFQKGEKVLVVLDDETGPAGVVGGLHGKFTLRGATASRDRSLPRGVREYPLTQLERELAADRD